MERGGGGGWGRIEGDIKQSSVSPQRSLEAPIWFMGCRFAPHMRRDAVWRYDRFSLSLRELEARWVARGLENPRDATALADEGWQSRGACKRCDVPHRGATPRAILTRSS